MGDRPILFSGPMVRAILDGRKTQTRRIVRIPAADGKGQHLHPVPRYMQWLRSGDVEFRFDGGFDCDVRRTRCPYGEPGDRLWVKEPWARTSNLRGEGPVVYREGGERGAWVGDGGGGRLWIHHGWTIGLSQHQRDGRWFGNKPDRWTPSIYMPRWASRITLEITDVRVQRLQEISEEDAMSEGLRGPLIDPELDKIVNQIGRTPSGSFAELWDLINGKRAPWSSNPWVWALTFRRVQPESATEVRRVG